MKPGGLANRTNHHGHASVHAACNWKVPERVSRSMTVSPKKFRASEQPVFWVAINQQILPESGCTKMVLLVLIDLLDPFGIPEFGKLRSRSILIASLKELEIIC